MQISKTFQEKNFSPEKTNENSQDIQEIKKLILIVKLEDHLDTEKAEKL